MENKPTYKELEQKVKVLEEQNLGLRQLNEALESSSEPWQRTFDAINDAICLLDNEGKILHCNGAMKRLLGKTSQEIIGQHCWELVHGISEPIEGCPVVRMRNTLKREAMVLAVNDRWLEVFADPLLDQVGNLTGAVHIISDITDQRRAEVTLRESEERYRGFFENSTDFIYTLDLKGNFTDVNKAAEDLTGYTEKELIGMNYRDYAAADSHEKIFQAFHRVFEEGEPLQDFPLEVTLKDGAKKYFETSVSPLRKGRKITGFHGSSRDITRRVHSEQALKRSEERYRTILEEIEEGYFEVDIRGKFTFFNDSLSKILGYSNDELMKMDNRDYMPPESSRKIYNLFNKIYNTGNPIKKEGYGIIKKDGSHAFHELSASLIKDQTGKPIGFRGIAHDITDLKNAQDALLESEDK